MTENRRGFLRRIRLRMRMAWFAATVQRLAPYLGLAVVVILGVGWLTPFDDAWLAIGILAGAFLVSLFSAASVFRISDWDASRAAERGLNARDIFTTALEFNDESEVMHQIIQRRADAVADASDPAMAIPIGVDHKPLRLLGIAAAIAVVIGFLPPLGSTPALSSDVRDAIAAEADQIEQLASAAKKADVETSDEIVEELGRLAEELRNAESLEQALDYLEGSEKRLEGQIDPEFLSQKAAVQGLARDLALRPLTGDAAVDPSSQLEEVANSLESLSEPELASLADRLNDLAGSQVAGNPELSSQLSEAARALSAGDLSAAAESLRSAGAGQNTGLQGARGQQALSEAQRALESSSARLSGATGQSDGSNPGEGRGSGQGQGEGSGQGQGEGSGQGQGSGQGAPGGSPSGQVSGAAPGSGNAAGQGGQGSVGQGSGQSFGSEVATAEIFDPVSEGNVSDFIQVGIDGGTGSGAIVAKGEAPTETGQSVVPYSQVLPDYLNQAADSLAELELPPSMRGIVQKYFDLLAEEATLR